MFFLFKIHSFKEINLLKKYALKKKQTLVFLGLTILLQLELSLELCERPSRCWENWTTNRPDSQQPLDGCYGC